ncbi:MAG: hypothetical protein U5N53_15640 [Mycobacterium sp.]|nr:hypothetical protein [Mycobacterium sp.]
MSFSRSCAFSACSAASWTYDVDSLAIDHFEASLSRDVELLRRSPAIPATVRIVGMVFDIDRDEFAELVP